MIAKETIKIYRNKSKNPTDKVGCSCKVFIDIFFNYFEGIQTKYI